MKKKIFLTFGFLLCIALAVWANQYYKFYTSCSCGARVCVELSGSGYSAEQVRSARCEKCHKYTSVTYVWPKGDSAPTIKRVETH